MKELTSASIRDVVERIVAGLKPERVYLYGSHAYGSPNEDSDVDILVVVPDSAAPARAWATKAYHALGGMAFPAEIKVDSHSEFERRSGWLNSLESTVRRKGQLLYDAAE